MKNPVTLGRWSLGSRGFRGLSSPPRFGNLFPPPRLKKRASSKTSIWRSPFMASKGVASRSLRNLPILNRHQALHGVDTPDLSTTWPPSISKTSPIVNEAPEAPSLRSPLDDWRARFSSITIRASPSQFTFYHPKA